MKRIVSIGLVLLLFLTMSLGALASTKATFLAELEVQLSTTTLSLEEQQAFLIEIESTIPDNVTGVITEEEVITQLVAAGLTIHDEVRKALEEAVEAAEEAAEAEREAAEEAAEAEREAAEEAAEAEREAAEEAAEAEREAAEEAAEAEREAAEEAAEAEREAAEEAAEAEREAAEEAAEEAAAAEREGVEVVVEVKVN